MVIEESNMAKLLRKKFIKELKQNNRIGKQELSNSDLPFKDQFIMPKFG